MSAITVSHLTKKFGDLTAVDDVSLAIEEGELFALLGMNGAGKTTTIKMLSCLIFPTQGDAVLLGDSIRKDPIAIKQKSNVSPQETAVAPNLSVLENLSLMAGIYGQDKDSAQSSARDMSSRFGLNGVLNKSAKKLSGGMQRRLSIAMALISDPEILFLDEPTLGLDVLARRELWSSIKQLKGKVTIILTTHYLEEVEALSDRVGIMNNGKLVAVGTTAELVTQAGTENFEDAFVSLSGGEL
ncbi:MAG: ABC transporter ATP-binding protein [Clostridiales bacterium]|nr:ABC transporter ATP-binding protein [Clostridiales bacterium]